LRIFTTFSVLFTFWLLLSGIYNTLTISLGVVSCLLVIFLLLRMEVIDHEGQPVHLALSAILKYWSWLFSEILFSGINLTKIILNPKLPISPTVDFVPSSQLTDLGKTTFANSITLTPGTIAIEIKKGFVLVHSIESRLLIELKLGEMDSRVSNFERVM
jgi:multicomponent Na+:H+ antiporter subunit E